MAQQNGSIIVTPTKPRVSHPKGITLRILDDIVPMRTDERSMTRWEAHCATGYRSQSQGFGQTAFKAVDTERSACGRRPGDFDRVDHGSYISYRQGGPVAERPVKGRKVRAIRQSDSRDSVPSFRYTDDDIRAYLNRVGLGHVTLTKAQRQLCIDAMTHAAQVAAYENAA